MISHASTRRYWESRANALARRINIAAWLGRIAPLSFFVASAGAIAFHALRRHESALEFAWLCFGGALCAAAWLAWWQARRDYFSGDDARVLLESELRLDSRLTAARLGLVAWPPEEQPARAVLRWRLQGPTLWFSGAILLVALALLIPVPQDPLIVRHAGPPPALADTEALLAALKEMKVAEPRAIEHLQERAQELARRPADEQYSHSALEAADALRNQALVAATGLARGLDDAANALRQAGSQSDSSGPAGQLSAALSGLRDGVLPANKELLANLPASASDLRNLSAEDRARLAQALSDAAEALNGVCGAHGAGAQVASSDKDGAGWGAGGPGGGGDSAPLILETQQSDAGNGQTEAIAGDALKRFALGDKLGTTSSAPEADPTKSNGPNSAGAIQGIASGGDAAWVNRLTPAERAALKQFFK